MIWQLLHNGAAVAAGSYQQILDIAEEWQVLERRYHLDGTELAPRWMERGYSMQPQVSDERRAAA